MPYGPGKYDALATYAREQAKAAGVVLIIVEGDKGSGFSVQCRKTHLPPHALASLLRSVADSIEQDGRS